MFNKHRACTTENEILDLLPGYVMGILNADELLLVNEYIRKFPYIAKRIHALENITAALAFSAAPLVPPSKKRFSSSAHVIEIKKAAHASQSHLQ